MSSKFLFRPGIAVLGALLMANPAKAQQTGWYLGAGLGMNRIGAFDQTGFNADMNCYPGFQCDSAPAGYRWFYDIEADSGSALELAAGRAWSNWRAEIALTRLDNAIDQQFTGIEFLNGSPVQSTAQSDYRMNTMADIGDFAIDSFSLNLYRDFPGPGVLMPYLGAGLGAARAEITELYFEERYTCISEVCRGRPQGEFDSRQRTDLSDTVYFAQLFAGADYDIGENLKLGLKLAWRHIDEFSAIGSYLEHASAAGGNTNAFSATSHWSASIELKRFFGERGPRRGH